MALTTEPGVEISYEDDEVAWLDAMVALIEQGRSEELDLPNLAEVLDSMGKRERRGVYNRLVVFITHLLKWEFQPKKRGNSWRGTIKSRRRKLRLILEDSQTLNNYATSMLDKIYQDARDQAAAEAGLPIESFPIDLVISLDAVLNDVLQDEK